MSLVSHNKTEVMYTASSTYAGHEDFTSDFYRGAYISPQAKNAGGDTQLWICESTESDKIMVLTESEFREQFYD